jgi:hypothetical protein
MEILRLTEELGKGKHSKQVARRGVVVRGGGVGVWLNPLSFIGLLFPGDKVPVHHTSVLKY